MKRTLALKKVTICWRYKKLPPIKEVELKGLTIVLLSAIEINDKQSNG